MMTKGSLSVLHDLQAPNPLILSKDLGTLLTFEIAEGWPSG
jgi:hypothetical protein